MKSSNLTDPDGHQLATLHFKSYIYLAFVTFNLALLEKFYYKESQIKIQAVCESIALDKMNKKYTTDQQPAARQVTRLEQKRLITLKIIFHQGVGQVPFKFKIL